MQIIEEEVAPVSIHQSSIDGGMITTDDYWEKEVGQRKESGAKSVMAKKILLIGSGQDPQILGSTKFGYDKFQILQKQGFNVEFYSVEQNGYDDKIKESDIVILCLDHYHEWKLRTNWRLFGLIKENAVVINHTPVDNENAELIRESLWKNKEARFVHAPLQGGSQVDQPLHLTTDNGFTPELEDIVKPIVSHYSQVQSLNVELDHSFLDADFDFQSDKKNYRTILIILNRPIDCPILFEKLLAAHDTLICSDGGANRLIKYQAQLAADDLRQKASINPHYIIGDLDSITATTREFYEQQEGVQIIEVEDQDRNDLDKAMDFAKQLHLEHNSKLEFDDSKSTQKTKKLRMLVYGAFGGRIDHTLQSIKTLHTYYLNQQKERPGTVIEDEVYLFDKYSKMVYLQSLNQDHVAINYSIKFSKDVDEKDGLGLVPIPTDSENIKNKLIETEGLKWNLGKKHELQTLSWDTLISTSNKTVGLGEGKADDADNQNEDLQRSIKVRSFGCPLVLSTTLVHD